MRRIVTLEMGLETKALSFVYNLDTGSSARPAGARIGRGWDTRFLRPCPPSRGRKVELRIYLSVAFKVTSR